jgi:hypothetical protein
MNPNNPYWKYVTWTSIDNWYLPWMESEIEAERLSGTPEDIIQREYYAKWIPHAGLVYPEATDCIMTDGEIKAVVELLRQGHGTWYRAIDFGFENPFACITHVMLNEVLYAWDEYYRCRETIDYHAAQLAYSDSKYDYSINVPDLENPSDIAFLTGYTYKGPKGTSRLKGAWVTSGSKPKVVDRVKELRRLMGKGRYRINPQCTEYINELGLEKYPDIKTMASPSEKPLDRDNHGSSASGYLVHYLLPVIYNAATRNTLFGEERGAYLQGYNLGY